MPLAFVLDENLRGLLWRHLLRYNSRGIDPIDAVRVGDFLELPLGTGDPEVLQWCEANDRILVSHDETTLPVHLQQHLAAGGHVPGIFIVRNVPLPEVVEFLALVSYASDASEWRDAITFIP